MWTNSSECQESQRMYSFLFTNYIEFLLKINCVGVDAVVIHQSHIKIKLYATNWKEQPVVRFFQIDLFI